MLVEALSHLVEEDGRFAHHQCPAEVVLGAELRVHAGATDADGGRDRAHPHR